MTKSLKSLCLALLGTFVALSVTSCNEDSGNTFPDETLYDIVTLVENNDSGSVFEFRKDGDSPVITLTSTRKLSDEVKVGERLMIAYIPLSGVSYVSGSIELVGYRSVYNGPIVIGKSSDWKAFRTYDQRLTWINRSGNYLNVSAEIYILSQPRTYELVLDETTLNDEYPVAYIVFEPDTNGDGTMHTGYASWDISSVWALGTCKGLKVRLSNLDGKNEFVFEKNPEDIKPVE